MALGKSSRFYIKRNSLSMNVIQHFTMPKAWWLRSLYVIRAEGMGGKAADGGHICEKMTQKTIPTIQSSMRANMSNVGKNRGRVLSMALHQFAKYLIEEAHDISGLSYAKLDEKLGIPADQSYRYSQGLRKKSRSPQLASIQGLEHRVAKLLMRPEHRIVIQNHSQRHPKFGPFADVIVGYPAAGLNLRHLQGQDLQLGYEDDWPTYRRLKYAPDQNEISAISVYLWQWGVLWDRGILSEPWTREYAGISIDEPLEPLLKSITQNFIQRRRRFLNLVLSEGAMTKHDISALVEKLD